MADPIIVPRRAQDWFKENGDLTLRALRFFESITNQTNESVIVITDTGTELTSTASRVSRDAAKINSLELKEFEIVTTTVSIETNRNQIIICKNTVPITITLDPLAVAEDEVHIKRRGEEVEEIGLIDGLTNRTINVPNWSDHLVFDGTDWSVI
jgi:hypothetical protein